MRVFLTSPLIALLLIARTEGRSWRATPSSPLVPFVVAKDLTSSRSLSSMSSSIVSTGASTDSKKSPLSTSDVEREDIDTETANNIAPDLSDDLARGGHSTATARKENQSEEETPAAVSDVTETPLQKNESDVLVDTEVSKSESEEEHVEETPLRRRRARKKKKKMDTTASVYAKKLKVRTSFAFAVNTKFSQDLTMSTLIVCYVPLFRTAIL